MSSACKNCPFAKGARLGFVQDGLDALNDGCEPSCHMVVGAGNQFMHVLPTSKQICKGYLKYLEGETGYARPYSELFASD
jgi:hypothetical protein